MEFKHKSVLLNETIENLNIKPDGIYVVYSMLGIPEEMFTPMFATSRISGWCAHRLEELVNAGKIIRPAYKYVGWHRDYPKMEDR